MSKYDGKESGSYYIGVGGLGLGLRVRWTQEVRLIIGDDRADYVACGD